jgi:hypothetical protein
MSVVRSWLWLTVLAAASGRGRGGGAVAAEPAKVAHGHRRIRKIQVDDGGRGPQASLPV